ncbi:MAG: aminopeptidase [Phototrophicales bacterium]|nr:MAG: aminopeptidase [Phototrophicales bacterium]RMG72353.1 MAG: M42 family peptidase [Chloroflexota bacterium]
MLDLKKHLKRLVEAHAPSGHEAPLRQILREEWAELVDDMQQDGLGSLIGIKHATRPLNEPRKIMLAAHMDEIGMMVRDIVDGFIFVHRISGVDNRVMLAQPVIVHGKRPLKGIVATTPPHLLNKSEQEKYPTFDDLVIDLGLPAQDVAELVQLGDLITPDVPMIELQGKRVAAKAFDDRACVAAITVCLDTLQTMNHQWDVYATATVQEETGLYGAKTAAYHINPDIAIALDVTFAEQPGVSNDDGRELGGGPVMGIGPNFHIKLSEKLKDVAKYHEIKLQYDALPGRSGTDAWSIQVSRGGVPTLLLSIPLRNMHSPVETLDLTDIERAGRLLAHFIASLDADFLAAIDWDDLKQGESA